MIKSSKNTDARGRGEPDAVAAVGGILPHGQWTGDTSFDHAFDEPLAGAIADLLAAEGVREALDLGCGPGRYVRHLRERGIAAFGVDGHPRTQELTEGAAATADLALPLDLGARDAALCLETGEHVPKEFAACLLDNVARHARRLVILSWGVPGQDGRGHVNCQPNEWVMREMEARGFRADTETAGRLRGNAWLCWFKHTLMVFRKADSAEPPEAVAAEARASRRSRPDFPIHLLVCEGENPRRGPAMERVRAVFGRDPAVTEGVHKDAPDFHERTRLPSAEVLTRGQTACAAGHRAMLEAFLRTKAEYALMLEDDIIFCGEAGDFDAVFTELQETCPGWEWVQFRRNPDWQEDAPVYADEPAGALVRRAEQLPWCTVCYGVSRAGARKLLAKSTPLDTPFDAYTRYCWNDRAYMGPVLSANDTGLESIIHGD